LVVHSYRITINILPNIYSMKHNYISKDHGKKKYSNLTHDLICYRRNYGRDQNGAFRTAVGRTNRSVYEGVDGVHRSGVVHISVQFETQSD